MSLMNSIQTDITNALRSGQKTKLETLRFIVSQIKYKQIDLRRDVTDDDVVTAIRKQIKELTEALEQFKKVGRADLVQENAAQIAILSAYLPQEISDDELMHLVRAFIDEEKDAFVQNPRSFTGKVVSALKSKASADRIVKVYNSIQGGK